MRDYSDKFTTSDGTPITPNLRVFGYDMKWGNVEPGQFRKLGNENRYGVNGCDFDGWYTVVWDDGKRDTANGTRMAHKTPLSTDPNPNRVIDKDGHYCCNTCLSVTMGTCMDADCNCHIYGTGTTFLFDTEKNERELWFGTPENPIL